MPNFTATGRIGIIFYFDLYYPKNCTVLIKYYLRINCTILQSTLNYVHKDSLLILNLLALPNEQVINALNLYKSILVILFIVRKNILKLVSPGYYTYLIPLIIHSRYTVTISLAVYAPRPCRFTSEIGIWYYELPLSKITSTGLLSIPVRIRQSFKKYRYLLELQNLNFSGKNPKSPTPLICSTLKDLFIISKHLHSAYR